MDYEITTPQYYNRANDDEFKGIKKLLFKSGDILQNTEMNEIQELAHNELKKLTAEFIGNGQVITDATVQLLYDMDSFTPYRNYEPRAVAFNNTYSILYVLDGGSNRVKQYNLSVAGDITSATFSKKSFLVTEDMSEATDMNISSDGKKCF